MSVQSMQEEVVELARSLIRIDTSNPPGGETEAAKLLAHYLAGAGSRASSSARIPNASTSWRGSKGVAPGRR